MKMKIEGYEVELNTDEFKQLFLKKNTGVSETKVRFKPTRKYVKSGKYSKTANRQFKNWTPEEDIQLYELTKKGHTPAKIAKKLGRSKKAIQSRKIIVRPS